jgi:tRNA (guanine-N7-)-methyltransferase
MRLRNVRGAKEKIESSKYIVLNYKELKGNYKSLFGNDNPIHIEIGMGKGRFIVENAKKYPHINFIGIEKFDSVIVRAIEKIEEEDIPNLRLIRMDAQEIVEVFDKEIETIYLNFSDPWPKVRHAHRRLSSRKFLERYDSLFKGDKRIVMKTDNRHLFEFSVKEFTDYGYTIDNLCLDVYNEGIIDNIPTEYESKFSSKGFPIYLIEISKR